MHDVTQRSADELDRLEAENFTDARRDEGQDEGAVGFPHPVGGEARQVVEALLGDVHLETRRHQVGDVEQRAADRDQSAGPVEDAGVTHPPVHRLPFVRRNVARGRHGAGL